jgi:hypothetical protein
MASVASAALDVGFALVLARRGGHRIWAPLPQRWLPAAVCILAAYSALGTMLNAASHSPVERALMVPTSLSLAVLCACVAVSGDKKEPRSNSLAAMSDDRAQRAPEGAR